MRRRVLLLLVALLGWQAQAANEVGADVSPRRAFWSSLLIPGWGQRAAGADQSALRFFAVDLGLWAGYFGMQRLSAIRREHYRTYAADHAGARGERRDEVELRVEADHDRAGVHGYVVHVVTLRERAWTVGTR